MSENWKTHADLATQSIVSGQADEAEAYVNMLPNDGAAQSRVKLALRGCVAVCRKEWQAALQDLAAAYELGNRDPLLLQGLAAALLETKRWLPAQQVLQELIQSQHKIDFSTQIFQRFFQPHLQARAGTFREVFQYLRGLGKSSYCIVETGTARIMGNWADGQSTLMFDQFILCHSGKFVSIDVDQRCIDTAKKSVSAATEFIHSDSVVALREIAQTADFPTIDLLYLDSFDLDPQNIHPSAWHHAKELLSIIPKLSEGCLVVVDDNVNGRGKGTYVKDYLLQIGCKLHFDEYQIGFIMV